MRLGDGWSIDEEVFDVIFNLQRSENRCGELKVKIDNFFVLARIVSSIR